MANGFSVCGLDFSPVKGPEGNIEFLMFVQKEPASYPVFDLSGADAVAQAAHQTLDKAPV